MVMPCLRHNLGTLHYHMILRHIFATYLPEMSMDLDLDFFGQDLGFFAGFGSDLDLRSRQVPDLDLDLDLQIFLTTLLIC